MALLAVLQAHFTGKCACSVSGIRIVLAFSCGRAKTIQKRYVWMRVFLNTEKKIRFQTKTDTCGRGQTCEIILLL